MLQKDLLDIGPICHTLSISAAKSAAGTSFSRCVFIRFWRICIKCYDSSHIQSSSLRPSWKLMNIHRQQALLTYVDLRTSTYVKLPQKQNQFCFCSTHRTSTCGLWMLHVRNFWPRWHHC